MSIATTKMKLEEILLSEISQVQRDKCYIISLLHRIQKIDHIKPKSTKKVARGYGKEKGMRKGKVLIKDTASKSTRLK
jgi:hypothetical protein